MGSEAPLPAEMPSEAREIVAAYWRYRKRTARTLVAILAASVAVVVLEPRRWFPDETGTTALYGAWGFVALLVLLAFRWNGEMAERHGYCVGKFGRSPNELEKSGCVSERGAAALDEGQ